MQTFISLWKIKLKATQHLLNHTKQKIPFVVLRFYQIYGPIGGKSFNSFVIDSSLKDRQFKCSPGHQLRDFLFVNDAISAVLKSLKIKIVLVKF